MPKRAMEPEVLGDEDKDDATPILRGKILLKLNLPDAGLKRRVIDFGRKFYSGSIFRSVLPNSSFIGLHDLLVSA